MRRFTPFPLRNRDLAFSLRLRILSRNLGSRGQAGNPVVHSASLKSQILDDPPPSRPVVPLRPPSTPRIGPGFLPLTTNDSMLHLLFRQKKKKKRRRRRKSTDSASLSCLDPHRDPYHDFRAYSAVTLSQTGQVPESCLQTQ